MSHRLTFKYLGALTYVILAMVPGVFLNAPTSAEEVPKARLENPLIHLPLLPRLLLKRINETTTEVYGSTSSKTATRKLLSIEFATRLRAKVPTPQFEIFRSFMADRGYPTGLSGAELQLYYHFPEHPIFTTLQPSNLLRERAAELSDQVAYFAIDLVRALNARQDRLNDPALRSQVDSFIETSSLNFDARAAYQDAQRKINPFKPTLPECRRMLQSMTTEELTNEYAREMSRRLFPDGIKD